MSMKKFHRDLADGRFVTKYVAKLFEETGAYRQIEMPDEYDPYKDITLTAHNGKKTMIEVKFTPYGFLSKNVIVEFECRGKPSGIARTKAHFWALVVFTERGRWELIVIPTKELRDMVSVENRIPPLDVRKGGDGNQSKFFVIPSREFDELEFFLPGTLKVLQIDDDTQKRLNKIAVRKIKEFRQRKAKRNGKGA